MFPGAGARLAAMRARSGYEAAGRSPPPRFHPAGIAPKQPR